MLEQGRVVEIWVKSSKGYGSGYVLSEGCILTAYHVVEGHKSSAAEPDIEFRLLGQSDWLPVSDVAWHDESLDLALLKFSASLPFQQVPLPRVTQRDFNQPLDCSACGFPSFAVVTEVVEGHKKILRSEYRPGGCIQQTDQSATRRPGWLRMQISSPLPEEMSSWKGMSGSAVFANQGDLLGVVVKGPENLKGQELDVLSLQWLLQQRPDFNQALQANFRQSFEFYDPVAAQERDRYYWVIRERELQVQAKCTEIAIEECRRNQERQSSLAVDPQMQQRIDLFGKPLEDVLNDVDSYEPRLLLEAWNAIVPHPLLKMPRDVRSIHTVLLTAKDIHLLPRFLIQLLDLLDRQSRETATDTLTSLSSTLNSLLQNCGQPVQPSLPSAYAADSSPQASSLEEQEASTTVILFKLQPLPESDTESQYCLNIYKISDSEAYQSQIQENSSTSAESLSLDEPQLQELSLEQGDLDTLVFQIEETDDRMANLKEKLSAIIQAVFETYPNLRELAPHLLFYVPQSLLALDFHNLDFDVFDTLGFQFPVAVSCLERYEQPEKSPLRRFWQKRWDALTREPQKPLYRYLQAHNREQGGKPLDLRDVKALNKQLLQIDKQGETVVGLRFDGLDQNFLEICDTVFATGLSLFLCPSQPLTPQESQNLDTSLQACPKRFLRTLQNDYRIEADSDAGDAGALSVLMDNPYLPLPNIEYS